MKENKSILLLEDDHVDAMTVKRALKDVKISNPLFVSANGEDGLQFLETHKDDLPCIIWLTVLLDIPHFSANTDFFIPLDSKVSSKISPG